MTMVTIAKDAVIDGEDDGVTDSDVDDGVDDGGDDDDGDDDVWWTWIFAPWWCMMVMNDGDDDV